MEVKAFFDLPTYTLTYVAFDDKTRDAVVIDPLLNFDPDRWRTSHESIDQVRQFLSEKSLKVHWIVDTHAHADHMTGMAVLKDALGAPTAIGAKITGVQDVFASVYDMPELRADGHQWDRLVEDGEELTAGSLTLRAIHTPGHTPACMSYLAGDVVFTGDALFMPDYGTGRCDFPKGSAEDLYHSVHEKLYALPDATRVFVGHDYMPDDRPLLYETTIGREKAENIQLKADTNKEAFVSFRKTRDASLEAPKLIYQSLQVNITAGHLPAAAKNGRRFLKMPIES